jgi:hypothetical protein
MWARHIPGAVGGMCGVGVAWVIIGDPVGHWDRAAVYAFFAGLGVMMGHAVYS